MSADLTHDEIGKCLRELKHEIHLRKNAEDALRRYEMIISTVNDPMSFVDRDYIYRTVNDAYARVFQRPREKIVGHSVSDLLGQDVFEEKIRKYIDKCLGGHEVHYEDWFEYPTWGHRYVIMSYYPFFEDDHTVSGMAVTASDITEHKLAEDALRKYELIISTVNDPMSFIDRDYIYQAVNDAYTRIFRKPREEIIGKTIEDLMGHGVFEEKIRRHIEECLEGEEVHYEDWFEYPGLGKRYVIVNYYPFYEQNGFINGVAVSVSDITEHKQAEAIIRKKTEELLIRNEIDHIFLTVSDDDVTREMLMVVLNSLKINYGSFGHVNHRGEVIFNSMIWDRENGCKTLSPDLIFTQEQRKALWEKALREKTQWVSDKPIDVPEGYIPITDSIAVPVVFQDEVIGMFAIANGSEGLGDEEKLLLGTIANHIAPILNARLQRNREEEKRKKVQEELRRANDELEEMVAKRTAELVATNERLVREIEERKRIHMALAQSKEMLCAQYRGFPVPTFTLQKHGQDFVLVDFNTAAELATNGHIAGCLGKGLDELSQGDSLLLQDVRSCYKDKLIISKEIYHRLFTTDEDKYINLTCSYVPPDMVMVHMEDITERKKAENALKESEESLRELSGKLFDAKEEERKHISRELHDGIGQYLTSIKFLTENTINQMEKGLCAKEVESLRMSIPIIQTIIDEVRKMSMNLRPSTLDDFGICVTIDWFCKEFQKIYKSINVMMDLNIDEDKIPDDLKIIIFRILQEALNNVAIHSGADSVEVSLEGTDSGIGLTIRDNGTGFDMHSKKVARSSNRGLGLASMKERTELYGGIFRMESSAGTGTAIHAFWPVPGSTNG